VTAQLTLIGTLASISEQVLGHLEVSHVLARLYASLCLITDKCMVYFALLYFYIVSSCSQWVL